MDHICECDKINWEEKFKEKYIHDDKNCKLGYYTCARHIKIT